MVFSVSRLIYSIFLHLSEIFAAATVSNLRFLFEGSRKIDILPMSIPFLIGAVCPILTDKVHTSTPRETYI